MSRRVEECLDTVVLPCNDHDGERETLQVLLVLQTLVPGHEHVEVYPHIHYLHPAADHLFLAVADDWRKESEWTAPLVRAKHPKQVTYRVEPWADGPDVDVRHDRAYWMNTLRGRQIERDDLVSVDLTTSGCGGSLPIVELEPSGAGESPTPWESQSAAVVGQSPVEQANAVAVTSARP